MLLASSGRLLEAIEQLEAAMVAHEQMEEPFERARTLLVLGEVQRRARRRGAARASVAAALSTFEDLGAAIWVTRARSELARVGIGAGRANGLSKTQAEIARLVALGRTNREVAEALFMSPHTVDTHLRTIYRILGVRSRTELAGRLHSAGDPGS
jgi:DNA-binding CsgD family transcriptional regulator